MSHRYVVLPRGINVGTGNRVPMAELRAGLSSAGYLDVVTVLQSGNLIVTSETGPAEVVADDVHRLLRDGFGVDVVCMARTAEQFQRVLDLDPLADVATDPARYLVNFLSAEPDADLTATLLATDHGRESLVIDGTEAYVCFPERSDLLTLSYANLGKRLGVSATARNWNTVRRIAAKL